MKELKSYLVTTAIEETWPSDRSPIIFIGEWCKLYSRKAIWKKTDHQVLPYHWDDRQKLFEDYLFLNRTYEEFLKAVSLKLNEYHGKDYSIKYWRILLGPWLGYFIQILFDRWSIIKQFSKKDPKDIEFIAIEYEPHEYIPGTMKDFVELIETDHWNQMIFQEIISRQKIFKSSKLIQLKSKKKRFHTKAKLREQTKVLCNKVSRLFFRSKDVFIISSYMSFIDLIKLQIKLRQFPTFWFRERIQFQKSLVGSRKFEKMEINNISENKEFVELVCNMLFEHIPVSYLEGYNFLVSRSLKTYPITAKEIFDKNSWNTDDLCKVWIANQVQIGKKYYIGQHGGNYGVSLWNFTEDHQLSISDKFISWGWIDKKHTNIIPLGNSATKLAKPSDILGRDRALLVQMALPRFSYHMYSVVVATNQFNSYFKDQMQFVDALSTKLQNKLLVRLYPADYQLSQKTRWLDFKPNIEIDDGEATLDKTLQQARVFISTYNATTYLETLSKNIPTIIFWNPDHWELRESAQAYFDDLAKAGIYHTCPKSAAKQLEKIWDDVGSWWYNSNTQLARERFCKNYNFTPTNSVELLANIFK